MKNRIEVGQIWADNDPRSRKRNDRQQLEIIGYENLGPVRKVKLRNLETGKVTAVNIERMKPTSTGYRFVGYKVPPDDDGMPRTLLGREMAEQAIRLEQYLHRNERGGVQTCEHPEACDFLTMFPAKLRAIEDEAAR